MRIAKVRAEGEEPGKIGKTCPKIVQLDLSRNLFERMEPVVEICLALPALQSLSIKCVLPMVSQGGCLLTQAQRKSIPGCPE